MDLEVRGIQKKFGRKKVLDNISFAANKGMCVGILGENGCGKSTLLSILAGVQKADGGSCCWHGKEMLKKCSRRSSVIGYVPQGTPLLQELTALDNLKLWYADRPASLKRDLEEGVPAMLGVTEFLKVPVYKMSGGMKKRLSISCASAHNPQVLLLDEPSAALDLIAKERIYNYFLDCKKRGKILLLATHDVQELSLCDVWYIIKNGKLVPFTYNGNVHALVGRL